MSDDVAKAHQYFIKEISIIGENRFTTTTDDFVPNLSDDESDDDMSSCMSEEMATFTGSNKPFGSYVAKRLSKYPSEVIKDNACARNEYYCNEFWEVLTKKWIPTIPFWTSILRGTVYTLSEN